MLSQTAEYAIRAVAYLAGQDRTARTTAQISAATHISTGYLSKVMQSLGRAGIVVSQRGLHGGFALAKDPEQLTVLDVVGAVDPPKRVRQCPLDIEAHSALCPLHKRLDRVYASFEDALRETTMADMLVPPRCENAGAGDLT